MAKKSNKRSEFPKIAGIQFRKKLPHAAGMGRYLGRLVDLDEEADVLCLAPNMSSQIDWAERLASADSDAWPAVLSHNIDGPPWIAFRPSEGRSMESWLESNAGSVSEIQALNVVMQIAVKLHSAHGFGVPHGRLGSESVYLRTTSGGLEEVDLLGWAPLPDGQYETAQQEDLKALGQLLYQLLTGVLPPSAQTAADEELEGDSAGAFDDVLMDWIDEDRDLRGLGKPAIEALTDSGSFKSVLAFIEALQPHFSEHLKTTIEETGGALEEDRAFMMEVERQRARLKELETRQRFIRDWLGERLDRIDECEAELERQTARLTGLENLQTQIDLSLGATLGLGQNRAIADVLSSWTPGEDEDAILLDDEVVLSVEPPPVPPISADDMEDEPDAFEDEHSPAEDIEEQESIRIGLVPSMLIIFALVAIGGVGAAYLSRNTVPEAAPSPNVRAPQSNVANSEVQPSSPPHQRSTKIEDAPPPEQRVQNQLPAPTKAIMLERDQGITVETAEPEPPSAPLEVADALVALPEIMDVGVPNVEDASPSSMTDSSIADAGAMIVNPDAQTQHTESDAAMPDVASPAEPPSTIKPNTLPPPPEGMVTIQGGELWTGITEAQAEKLVRMCFYDRARFNQTPCNGIRDEVLEKKNTIRSFYMDRTEVSQGEYDRCKARGRCKQVGAHWQDGKQPATGMTYHNAKRFCEWKGARLPTHEEWLYAARGPQNTRVFPWGDQTPFKAKPAIANHGRFSNKSGKPDRSDRNKYAGPVNIFSDTKSPFGAINLVGNVREWTATKTNRGFMVAGGGWRSPPHRLRLTRRESVRPNTHMNDIGFRCVRSIEAKP